MPTQTTSAPERLISSATAVLLGRGQRAERRAVAADDLQAGVAQAQVARELGQRAVVAAAVEVEALPGRGGAGAGPVHQLGAVDARRGAGGRARCSAQTSGWPSGTVKSAPSTAARSSASSWQAITVWTAATQT